MASNIKLFIVLAGILQASLSLANPVRLQERGTLHTCSVFVQRWWDSSFDLAAFGYNYTVTYQSGGRAITEVETVGAYPGQFFSTIGNIGSYPVVTTDVANPAVVNGVTDWNDPGKLSFSWGTTTWDSYSAGSPCAVYPVGDAGAALGGATTYYCYFQCDS